MLGRDDSNHAASDMIDTVDLQTFVLGCLR